MTIEDRLTCLEINITNKKKEMERIDAVYTVPEMKDMGLEIERLQEIYVGLTGHRYEVKIE